MNSMAKSEICWAASQHLVERRSDSHWGQSCPCLDLTLGRPVRVGAHQPLAGASRMPTPPAQRRPAGAGTSPGRSTRLRGLPAVLRQRLSTPARTVVSANPSLHPDDAFELPQLALAEPPRRGVHGRCQRGQRALRVARQARRRPALVIEQSGRRRGVGVEGVPSRGGALSHDACSDQPPGGGRPRPSLRPSRREGDESPSAVSSAGPSAEGMHRSRRASFGVLPRQGQALTGGLWPALTWLLAYAIALRRATTAGAVALDGSAAT